MSNRTERNRQRRWNRKTRMDHQAESRVAHEMSQMARMMERGRQFADALVWGALEQMAGDQRHRHSVTGELPPKQEKDNG